MSGSQVPLGSTSSKRLGKALEKSNFAHTCNLLSQYVKERGSIRDLNLAGIAGKSEATAKTEESKATTTILNLLENVENSGQLSSQLGKPVNPFPRLAPSLVTSTAPDDTTRKASSSKEEAPEEPKRAQMTIFYAGEVMVFDDFPAEKAKEIMLLACSKGYGNGIASGSWKTHDINTEKSCFPAEKAQETMLLAGSGGSGKCITSGSWKTSDNNTEKSYFPAEKDKEILLLASSRGSGNGIASVSWKASDNDTDKSCFPAEKAEEIMLLANNGGSRNGIASGSWKPPGNNKQKSCSGDAVASSFMTPANPISTAAQESHQHPKPEANTSDLPIARRSSLHRFLEKRKDRAVARGPYQLHNNNNNNDRLESSSKNDQEQLELKL